MYIVVILPITLSFAVTFFIVPYLAKKFISYDIVGVDVHKLQQPICAEMGGVPVTLGFLAGVITLSFIGLSFSTIVTAGLITILLTFAVGLFDDIVGMKQRYKPFAVAAASIPLIVAYDGRGGIWFPLIGTMYFHMLYPLVIIPLAVATSANFSNMLAGFNGLEAGIGVMALGTLGLTSILIGRREIGLIALVLCAAFAAFLRYNWYPARVFPGDTGTLMCGASIAVIGILASIEFVAILVSLPAAFDFAMKMLSKRPFAQRTLYGDSRITEEGTLEPAPYPALSHALLTLTHLDERKLVLSILAMEGIYALIAVALTLTLR